jgi:hypothetical protein
MITKTQIELELTVEEVAEIIKSRYPNIPSMMNLKAVPLFAIDSDLSEVKTIRFEGTLTDNSNV